MNISEEKSRLRKEIKQKRLKMTESDIQVKSNIICNKIINSQFYKESKCIYCYMAIQNEVDLSLVIRDALLADKTVAVPKVVNKNGQMYFAAINKNDKFENGNVFSAAFINSFLRSLKRNTLSPELEDAIKNILHSTDYTDKYFSLKELFEQLSDLCAAAEKKIVLMIDEVDSASNNQVFLDFLAQLRAQYIERDIQPTFRAVILAGVYDVKNLRRKIRPDEVHKYNSPWNIAADFKVDMSFSREEIAGMLDEYEKDYHTGMDVELLAGLIREYTSGYPFLVSRICQLLDEEISVKKEYGGKKSAWTKKGFLEAVRILLSEKNMLFESLREKLESYPELNSMLYSLLFTGKAIVYNYYETSINIATMFGFVKNENGVLAVSNRIFEIWLYNLYLSSAEMQKKEILAR